MGFFSYVRTADFWKQIGLMMVILIILVMIALSALGFFTRHGQQIKVTDIRGLRLEQLQPYVEQFGFEFVVIDSVYNSSYQPGTIISHLPAEGSIVKKGRTFYLVVAASQPVSVPMPNLVDLSLRQATALLEANGLVVGTTTEVSSIVKGAVVRQLIHGYEVEPDKLVSRGTVIDLELGDGKGTIPPSVYDSLEYSGELSTGDFIEGESGEIYEDIDESLGEDLYE